MKRVRYPKALRPLLRPISEIHQHPDNPNNGDLDELIMSIKKHGFVTAITADSRTGEIIAGNHRYQALLALGATEAPILWVDHWNKNQALSYLVADNEIARRAQMDKNQLLELLQYLRTTEEGLMGTGHTDATVERLMMELAQDMTSINTPGGFTGSVAPEGIYQVVIDFRSEEERDELFAELSMSYDNVRSVNL